MGLNMLAKAAQQRTDDVVKVSLEQITFDTAIQSREGLNSQTVTEYEADFREHGWGNFPAVELIFDGTTHWIGDGNHRYVAASQAGLTAIPARVKTGSRRDAILRSTSANNDHGLRRSNADKRRSVKLMLADEEWRAWSDHQLADHCAVDHKTVGKIRAEMESTGEIPQSTVRKAAKPGGGSREVNTTNIGSNNKKASPAPAQDPDRAEGVVEFAPVQPIGDLGVTHRPPGDQTLGEALHTQPDEVKAATFSMPAQPAVEPVAEGTEAHADDLLTDIEIESIIDDFFAAYQVLVAAEDQVLDYVDRLGVASLNSTRFTLINLILQDFKDNVKGQE